MEAIKVNLIPNGIPQMCHASQYDEGRQIRLDLFDGFTPYVIQSGDTFTLNVRKPDNHVVIETVTGTEGNTYLVIETTEQMTAVMGKNLCEIRVENDGDNIGSLNFIMQVEKDVIANGIPSESVIEDLDALVAEAVGDDFYTKSEVDDLVGGLIDDESTANNKTWSSEKIETLIDNLYTIETVSGSIASFETNLGKPLVSLISDIDYNASGINEIPLHRFGVNLCDEVFEVGDIDASTGQNTPSTTILRTKNYIPIKPNTTYYPYITGQNNFTLRTRFYDKNKNFIGTTQKNGNAVNYNIAFTTPDNAYYMRFTPQNSYGITYHNDMSINYPSSIHTYNAFVGVDNVIDVSGRSLYGGSLEITPTSAILKSTKNADGTSKTPAEIIVLSGVENIVTLMGLNNIFSECGNISECKYKASKPIDLEDYYNKTEITDISSDIVANCYSVNPEFTVTGFVNASGFFNSDASGKRTDYIYCEHFTTAQTRTSLSSSGCAIAFYDKDKRFISSGSVVGDGLKTYTATIPATAVYVIFSQYGYPQATATLSKSGSLESQIKALEELFIYDKASFSAFAKFGVCGDSLSVGHTRDASGTDHNRNIFYSWPQIVARDYGNVALNFGISGITAKGWLSDSKCYTRMVEPDNKCQCYIIGLGANDAENLDIYSQGIGTTADIDFNDMSNNADSFVGWYAKIINAINTINPTAIIFLLTLGYTRDQSANGQNINQAIRNMSALSGFDNVLLVDLSTYDDILKNNAFYGQLWGGHYSALGYANVARLIEFAISKVMNEYDNGRMLFEIPFIPYGSNNVLD